MRRAAFESLQICGQPECTCSYTCDGLATIKRVAYVNLCMYAEVEWCRYVRSAFEWLS